MARSVAALSRPGLAGCVVLTLLVAGWFGPGETKLIEISDPAGLPAPAGSDPSTVATVDPEPSAGSVGDVHPPDVGPVATVTDSTTADRGVQVAVGPPPTPPTTSPALIAGECESWRPLVERYGMPWSWAEPILWRESNCTHAFADRPSTRDLSVGAMQINYYDRSMAAWFAEAGWPFDLVRSDPEAAIAAAGALYAACGTGPWDRRAGYPCRGDGRLRTPAEIGFGS